MIKIAVYGKGGIGKSTMVCNMTAALADSGLRVMQIGCDPKADSTTALHGQRHRRTVLDLIREKEDQVTLADMIVRGYKNCICVEAGGPIPGTGCAGRGIIAALETLAEQGVYEQYKPDVVFYDVLGDVVCGGFSMPMRNGYADAVYIVTSGENMAIYAAANIAMAVRQFKDRGYARLGGLILNRRNVLQETEKVQALAADIQAPVIGTLSRSTVVAAAEEAGKTVIEAFPESSMAEEYRRLAQAVYRDALR